MNRRVYIAGPISNGHTANAKNTYKNVKAAQEYYYELLKEGWSPFCPHLSYYPWLDFPQEDDIHWARWIELDLDWIDSCGVIIRIPGDSIGADMEMQYAKEHNIPAFIVQSPRGAVEILKREVGVPHIRVELEKYMKVIEEKKCIKTQ
jgi:hypothetical protein